MAAGTGSGCRCHQGLGRHRPTTILLIPSRAGPGPEGTHGQPWQRWSAHPQAACKHTHKHMHPSDCRRTCRLLRGLHQAQNSKPPQRLIPESSSERRQSVRAAYIEKQESKNNLEPGIVNWVVSVFLMHPLATFFPPGKCLQ